MPETLPRVVVLGAGFGGIEAVKSLRRAPVSVTIIDRQNHHCFQPLLYQVATATLSPADIAWPVRTILRGQRNATVLMAEVIGIDPAARRVLLRDSKPVEYDFLIVATGATHSYFGHDEWSANAPGLKQIVDATRIRRSILMAFEHAELPDNETVRQQLLTFVIVGGGATGVEMAGAIAEIARHTLARDFRNIDPRTARIILVEAGPRILPALAADLADYAARALNRAGVEIRTSTRVTNCDASGVDTDQGRIDAGTVIWAAGVKASPAAQWLGAEADRAGRVLVGTELSLPGRPEVFVIGDAAAASDGTGKMAPGIAPAAKQMGRHAGKVIAARLAGGSAPPFRYRHAGDLATVGRRAAVVELGRLHLKGFPGWLFWSLIHIYFLIGLRHRIVVALMWLWDFITFQRGALLITDVPPHRQP